jgi:hypothetical protein
VEPICLNSQVSACYVPDRRDKPLDGAPYDAPQYVVNHGGGRRGEAHQSDQPKQDITDSNTAKVSKCFGDVYGRRALRVRVDDQFIATRRRLGGFGPRRVLDCQQDFRFVRNTTARASKTPLTDSSNCEPSPQPDGPSFLDSSSLLRYIIVDPGERE